MIFPFNMDFPCHWNPEIKCQKKRDCNGCEHQPADENVNMKRGVDSVFTLQ